MAIHLGQSLADVPGLRPSVGKAIEGAFGYRAVRDLLEHYPFRYVTRGGLTDLAHAKKGADAPSPWGADYAPDVVEPGTVEGTPKPVTIFGAPTYSDKARLAADFFIRAMPLGASITQGVASTDGNGYRKYFRDQLRFNGWKVNMVGSKQDGTMNDRVRTILAHPLFERKPSR